MSWFRGISLPNISNSDKYYYIPEVNCENNIFSILYPSLVKVNEKEISTPKRGISIFAISKEVINCINPAEDFTIAMTINFKGKIYKFSRIPLGNILTDDTINYPEYLTHAIISCGKPSINFGQEIYIKSAGLLISKFIDPNILEKLNKAINDTFLDTRHSSDFSLDNTGSDVNITVIIELSEETKKKLRETKIGPFILPELCESSMSKISNSPDLLIKSTVVESDHSDEK